MAHKHGHHHGQHHGGAEEHDAPDPKHLGTAEKSLSEALGISFVILKVIMIVLVVAFLVSGFKTVGNNEQALRLVFGRIQGAGEDRVVNSGWTWVFPYPIGEIVKIPVKKQMKLAINSFWYWEDRNDVLGEGPKPRRRVPEKLNPIREGYCLTRSEIGPVQAAAAGSTAPGRTSGNADGSDYNVVHCKWEIDYQVDNIEQFFSNVLIPEVQPGQIYEKVMTESVEPLLRDAIESAVVTAMVQYSIDEALQSRDRIPRHVKQLVQEQLDVIESGVRVTSVQLVNVEWPKQVNDAFEAYFTASQTSQQAISEARTYAEQTLTDSAGQMAEPLYEALMADGPRDEAQLEAMWSQVAGQAQDTLAQAQAYRTKVVEAAKANATYLANLLPEFQKRPELVKQRLYLDTMEKVLENAEEKFILQPSEHLKGQEIRVLVNRDPLRTKDKRQTGTSN